MLLPWTSFCLQESSLTFLLHLRTCNYTTKVVNFCFFSVEYYEMICITIFYEDIDIIRSSIISSNKTFRYLLDSDSNCYYNETSVFFVPEWCLLTQIDVYSRDLFWKLWSFYKESKNVLWTKVCLVLIKSTKIRNDDMTYNQLFAVLGCPCLSFRKAQNKLKMRLFWKTVRKLKGRKSICFFSQKIAEIRWFSAWLDWPEQEFVV